MNNLFDTIPSAATKPAGNRYIFDAATGTIDDADIFVADQSSSVSGIVRIRIRHGNILTFEIDTFDLRDVTGDRAKLLAWDRFINDELSKGWKYVFIERPITASGPAAGTTIVLHKIAGIIELACAKRDDVKFVQVAGARIKKFAGSQKKQEVLLLARDRWGSYIKDDNTADAAWLGDLALHVVTGAPASNQARREVVRDVLVSMVEPSPKAKRATKAPASPRTRKAVAA